MRCSGRWRSISILKESARIVAAVAKADADPWAQRKAAAALAGERPGPWRP